MMEPRIQYASASDGVSIAYWTLGEGAHLVMVPPMPFTHIELEWQVPEYRRWYERLASHRRLVRYDARGFGLSDREVDDFSPEAHVLDLEGVVRHLELEKFALLAAGELGPMAITYAARHPEAVSHLLLWCSWARRADVAGASGGKALRALLEQDWEIYTQTVARVLLGWGEEEAAQRFATFYRECTTPKVLLATADASRDNDASSYLPEVQAPTLVLHRRELPNLDVKVARQLASRIPNARLALLEGSSPLPFQGDMSAVLRTIYEFLGEPIDASLVEGLTTAGGATRRPRGGVHTILFTDIEGSTALTWRLGDTQARKVLREHEQIVREALAAHGGSEVKATGDGFMASFGSAVGAVECAIAVQKAFQARSRDEVTTDQSETIRVRIGMNAGEPIAEDDPGGRADLFGTAVNLAARIAAEAEAGEILVSDVVRQLTLGKGFLLADRGETVLRGFEDPVRVYEVRWREQA